jgi:hypothetical protein
MQFGKNTKRNSITFEMAKKTAKKCKSIAEFKKRFPTHYTRATRMKWTKKLFANHQNSGHGKRTPPKTMNIRLALKKAKQHGSRSALKRGCWVAWQFLNENSLLDKAFGKKRKSRSK